MNEEIIANQFACMGARFKFVHPEPGRRRMAPASDYSVDIRRDNRGEYFELSVSKLTAGMIDIAVLQVQPHERHLLLLVKKPTSKDRFLCGHDEREWFVAAVPGGVSSVEDAKDALKPEGVRFAEQRATLTRAQRNRRHNRAFVRQGEWFFVPESNLAVDPRAILRNEPIRRGSGKPHFVAELHRCGGQEVFVCSRHPNGIAGDAYRALIGEEPAAKRWGWRQMVRDARVYARGTVRHPDHKTITLHDWHRVWMNTETRAPTMRHVAFLD